MKRTPAALLVLLWAACAAGQAPATKKVVDYAAMERELVTALNRLRADPRGLIPALRERLKYFDGDRLKLPGEVILQTNEGAAAVEEAIGFLKKAPKRPALERSAGMSKAAAEHARELAEKNTTGHYSENGDSPADRLNRHGRWKVAAAENIAFGPPSGARMVLQLVVDDGVSGRYHRKNFFRPEMGKVGVACGPHPTYRTVCVIDLAGDYVEKAPTKPEP